MKAFFHSIFGDKKKNASIDSKTKTPANFQICNEPLQSSTEVWNNKSLPDHRLDKYISLSAVKPYPRLLDVPMQMRESLLIRKLRACSYMFNFKNDELNREREIKRLTLNELLDFVRTHQSYLSSNNNSVFTDAVYGEIYDMICVNLFRPLPNPTSKTKALKAKMVYLDIEDDEPFCDPNWPHLCAVYDLLFTIICFSASESLFVKKYLNSQFIIKLLVTLNSEDSRERDWTKAILHRIYGKFLNVRNIVKRVMNDTFLHFIYVSQSHNGIADLLEIVSSIINGFVVPLKNEHKVFLRTILIPLHSPHTLPMYHTELQQCINNIVDKDSTLTTDIISGLLKYWPCTNSSKEILFLEELESILSKTKVQEVVPVQIPLFKRLSQCLETLHYQVGIHALYLINGDACLTLLDKNRDLLSILIGPLAKNALKHWNCSIQQLSSTLLQTLQNLDSIEIDNQLKKLHINISFPICIDDPSTQNSRDFGPYSPDSANKAIRERRDTFGSRNDGLFSDEKSPKLFGKMADHGPGFLGEKLSPNVIKARKRTGKD